MFTIFQRFFTKKWAGNTGITSETTIPESRVRRRFRESLLPTVPVYVARDPRPAHSGMTERRAGLQPPLNIFKHRFEFTWLLNNASIYRSSSHSRFRDRRLTRDSAIVVSLVIPVFPAHFVVKNSGKIVKISFSDSRDQNKIADFFMIFLYDQYFLYKPPFPSS